MKRLLYVALCAFTLAGILTGPSAYSQTDKKSNDKPKPAPVIIRATAHTAHFVDFQTKMAKDRSLAVQVNQKGLDVAFTEWMQRDHPYVFAAECVKEAGAIATEFKTTNHMIDFAKLMEKRADLRLSVARLGQDAAFADWLRRERPDVYRAHFGLDANNKPLKKNDKNKKNEQANKKTGDTKSNDKTNR